MEKHSSLNALLHITIISIGILVITLNLPFKAKIFGDWTFHAEAKQITEWVWGRAPLTSVTLTKAPGPSLFYAVPYVFAGPGNDDVYYWRWAVVWNTLWSILSIWLICRAALTLFGDISIARVAWVSAFIVPMHIYYSIGVLAEIMAFSGCAFILYGISVFFRQTGTAENGGSISIILGILFLVSARPNSALLLPCFLLIVWFLWRNASRTLKLRLFEFLKIPLLVGTILLTTLSLGLRSLPGNQQQPLQESYLIYVMHHGRFQFRKEPWDWRFWENSIRPDSEDYQDWEESKLSLKEQIDNRHETMFQVYSNWLIKDFFEHPLNFFKQALIRLLFGHYLQINSADVSRFTIGPVSGYYVFWGVHFIVNLFNLTLITAAIVGFFRTYRKIPEILLMIVPWLSLIIFHAFTYMEHRYIFPVRPLILLFAAPALLGWVHYLKQRYNHSHSDNY